MRYGATMAVGISCAGTGLKEALDLMQPMLSDPVDYVRQGALIGTSMVLMQNAQHDEKIRLSEHRKLLAKVVGDKHEDPMAKFGAILATGLLDAGGRNMTISLLSKSGHKAMPAIVGCAIFTHFWFWHPLLLFVNLALTPTAAIGVNASLQMPTWRFKSHAPPATFAYPPPSKGRRTTSRRSTAAVLSITGKKKVDDPELAAQKAAEEKAAAEKKRAEQISPRATRRWTRSPGSRSAARSSKDLYASLVGAEIAEAAEAAAEAEAAKEGREEGGRQAVDADRQAGARGPPPRR